VVFALEEQVFSDLLASTGTAGRAVLDVGCGTGRHWAEILVSGPSELVGADATPEMLARLRERHPGARTHVVKGELLPFADASFDVVVSTLTLGHLADLDRAVREWCRILRPGGEVLLTEYHPEAYRRGLLRTFRHQETTFEVENHLHPVAAILAAFERCGLRPTAMVERVVDERARPIYERADALAVWERARGIPLIIGLHLRGMP
jgi:ubiquinone/menaquinone biosynthesis C-methylase UbiE